MFSVLRHFVEDEAGNAGVHYALVAGIVVAAVFSAFAALGQDFPNFLGQVACMISESPGCAASDL